MDELFVLVYFLIALNMCVILVMGYKECNNQRIGFEVVQRETQGLWSSELVENQDRRGMEADNIFTRNG